MEVLLFILLLLLLVLISDVIGQYVSFLPIALIQIMVGVIAALWMKGFTLEVETEWFLLLFIAPLLYKDGANFPREQLWNLRASILGNAIILVFITTLVGGHFLHWVIPAIPIAAAFALAAILSPTDPVAVNGIAKRVKIPHSIMATVKGESLINDASGLVAFNYAVVAVVTGYFSIKEATLEFVYMFIVGAIIGAILIIAIQFLRYRLRYKGLDDVVFHSLLQILTPFAIFFVAEEVFHASGVIAVVVGGIIHAIMRENSESFIAQEQLLTENIWSLLLYILNGVVFLLLGLTLPEAMSSVIENEAISNGRLLFFIFELGLVILGIRFIWIAIFNRINYHILKAKDAVVPSLKNTVISTLVGVRGTITMVGILSLPMLTASGEAFPERQLIIFLAGGVILFTLILATICLPLLNEKEDHDNVDLSKEKERMLRAAMHSLRQQENEKNRAAVYDLLGQYNFLLEREVRQRKSAEELKRDQEEMKQVRLEALSTEKWLTKQYISDYHLPQPVVKDMLYKIEVRERTVKSTNINAFLGRIQYFLYERRKSKLSNEQIKHYREIEQQAEASIFKEMLRIYEEKPKSTTKQKIMHYYKRLLLQTQKQDTDIQKGSYASQKEYLYLQSLEVQRLEIAQMLEESELTFEQSKELRRFINYIESILLFEVVE